MGQPISCGENPQYQYEPEKEMCWKDEEVQKTCCIFACSDDDPRRCAGDYSYGYSDNQNTLSGHLTYLKNAVEGVYGTSYTKPMYRATMTETRRAQAVLPVPAHMTPTATACMLLMRTTICGTTMTKHAFSRLQQILAYTLPQK